MLQKTSGIVLHTLKYTDTSLIVDIYTSDRGRVSYLVPVPKTRRRGAKAVFFQPLSMIEYESDFRSRLSLQRLREVRSTYLFCSLPYDPYKSAIALFLAEFLYRVLREDGGNAPLFSYLCYSVEWLDTYQAVPANFHLVFLMRLSRFLGFYPNLDAYHPGDYFDLRAACYVSVRPDHADVVLPAEATVLTRLMRMNYETMHIFTMNRAQRNRCLELILRYYRLHQPDFPELRSLNVLQELFV